MDKQRIIIMVFGVAALMVIVLFIKPFFPIQTAHSQSLSEMQPESSEDCRIFIHNLDYNQSYSIQISLCCNGSPCFIDGPISLAPGRFNTSVFSRVQNGRNCSLQVVLDNKTSSEFPVVIPSNTLFEIQSGGFVELCPWIFIE